MNKLQFIRLACPYCAAPTPANRCPQCRRLGSDYDWRPLPLANKAKPVGTLRVD